QRSGVHESGRCKLEVLAPLVEVVVDLGGREFTRCMPVEPVVPPCAVVGGGGRRSLHCMCTGLPRLRPTERVFVQSRMAAAFMPGASFGPALRATPFQVTSRLTFAQDGECANGGCRLFGRGGLPRRRGRPRLDRRR